MRLAVCLPHVLALSLLSTSSCKLSHRKKAAEKTTNPYAAPSPGCPKNLFTCTTSQECILPQYTCDGKKDCYDGTDEVGCGSSRKRHEGRERSKALKDKHGDYRCPDNTFKCHNTECIMAKGRCDGNEDCADGSDEWGCVDRPKLYRKTFTKKNYTTSFPKQKPPNPSASTSKTNKKSVGMKKKKKSAKELKKRGARKSETENPKRLSPSKVIDSGVKCPSQLFTCASGECVVATSRCNGKEDCRDGSDEKDCDKDPFFGSTAYKELMEIERKEKEASELKRKQEETRKQKERAERERLRKAKEAKRTEERKQKREEQKKKEEEEKRKREHVEREMKKYRAWKKEQEEKERRRKDRGGEL